jgi:tetratricopeptide (TPR) repeat protein
MTAGRHAGWIAAALVVACGVLAATGAAKAPIKGLTNPEALARAYDMVFDADFAGADAELARVCPSVPTEACDVVRAAALWWQIYLDLDNHRLDQTYLSRIAQTITRCEQWTAREPDRAEAWFYLGASYGSRVQYHAQRTEFLAAARDGKRIKNALEKALAIDRDIDDANFGIGMYEYYADAAPAALKFLRWLLLLPGGDKVKGLRQMVQTRNKGILLRSDAAYQLHFVYLWYEKSPDQALAMLDEVKTRHPGNPMFFVNIAQVHELYRGDRTSALASYRALSQAARGGTLRESELGESLGQLGEAEQLEALAESDRAIETLRRLVERRPQKPYGAVARAHLALGKSLDRMGLRAKALVEYQAAQATAPSDDVRKIREQASDGLSKRLDVRVTEAYRLSLEGWRAFERGALAEAAPPLDRAIQLRPDDGMHRYRRGRVFEAQGDLDRARTEYERVLRARPAPPAPMLAGAFTGLGRLHEAGGDLVRAAANYQWAARVYGIDAQTRDAAAQALARLRR